MSRFNVEVTEKDIADAKLDKSEGNSSACVVSRSIARIVSDATRIETDIQTIRFTRDGARYVYLTPYAVQGYVIAFDAGEPIEPFSFQLRNPVRTARRVRTEAGKEAARAYARTAKKQALDPSVEGSKAPAKHPKTKSSKPRPDTGDARKAYAKAVAGTTGPLTTTQPGGRRPPPRVFKTKTRSYGHRLLRVNQDIS